MDEKLAEEARKYYEFATVNLLKNWRNRYVSTADVIDAFYGIYPPRKSADRNIHTLFLHLTVRQLIHDGLLDNVSDSFSPPFVRLGNKLIENGINNIVSEKYQKLGDSGAPWLTSAFNSIADFFDRTELLEYYAKLLEEMEARPDKLASAPASPSAGPQTKNEDEDKWEPIKIDRDQPEYIQAIEASEAALREIESSNGYASSDPEERNAIVASVRGTLTAAKEGTPSRAAVIAGLVRPLEYVAKKFSDVTMGEIAKIAVSKLWALIASWIL